MKKVHIIQVFFFNHCHFKCEDKNNCNNNETTSEYAKPWRVMLGAVSMQKKRNILLATND